MNDRIHELAAKAFVETKFDIDTMPFRVFTDAFAELIVKECMRMCEVTEHGFDTHHATKEGNGAAAAKACIAEWFDIE